jgi:hypothetical protein
MSVVKEVRPGVRCLPIAVLPTGRHFIDLRLGEFRPVENPFAVVKFDSEEGRRMCLLANVVSCQLCGTHMIVPGTIAAGESYCVCCLHRIR